MITIKTVKIGDIVRFTKGRKAASIFTLKKDNSVRFIQIDDLRNDNNLKFTEEKGVSVNPDDIIIAWDGANAGTIGYGISGIIGSTLVKMTIQTTDVLPQFLGKFLQGKFHYLRDRCTGATIPHISKQVLSDIQLPLPSLEEQKRIVRELDAADTLRQKRKHAIALLDDYLNAVFLEMFGDPSHNIHNFPIGTIRNLVSEVKYGTSKKAEKNGQYPYLRMNNITYEGSLDLSDLKYINLTPAEREKYLVKKGDLLFNRTNSKDLVGKTTIYNIDRPMALAGYLIRVRTNENAVPEYVSGYLNSLHGKTTLKNMCKSIVGMANINAQELQGIAIIIPPIQLQNKFAEIVMRVEKLKQFMQLQAGELEVNFNAIMQTAFKEKAVNTKREYTFGLMQGIAAIIEALEKTQVQYGEMVSAKFLYFLQEIFKVPFGIKFVKNNFGPYNPDIKKAIESGISKSKFFARKNDCLVLGEKADTILKDTYPLVGPSRDAMTALLIHFSHAKSERIESIATICKAIQDSQSTDIETIQRVLADWKTPGANGYHTKADKFSHSVAEELATITRLGWDKMLLGSNDA